LHVSKDVVADLRWRSRGGGGPGGFIVRKCAGVNSLMAEM